MDIDTALKYMTIEKAIELEQRRFFCNADETINTIAIHCMEKQIPMKIDEVYQARIEDIPGKYILSGNCPVCGSPVPKKYWYCWSCGQRLEWPDN